MAKRMNLVQAKNIEGRDKPIWLRIGSGFLDEAGKVTGMKLDVLPLPDEKGEVWLRLFDADDKPQSQAPAGGGSDPWGNG